MPEVATGSMSQPSILKEMLANCARWQSLTNSADATEAATKIFEGGFRDDDETPIERPRATVWMEADEFAGIHHLTGVASGIVRCRIEVDTPESYVNEKTFGNAAIWFTNIVGQIMTELHTLGRSIAGGYLPLTGALAPAFLERSDEDRIDTEKDYCAVELAFPFGV